MPERSEARPVASAKVVILGAGHAGGSAAAFLRQYGHEGPIVLIGDEPIPPYQRPPLSKAWLKGEADADSLALKDADWYAENGCELRLNTTAAALNRGGKTIALSTGETVAYDILIIATGARARRLPIPAPISPGCWSCAPPPMPKGSRPRWARAGSWRSSAGAMSGWKRRPRLGRWAPTP